MDSSSDLSVALKAQTRANIAAKKALEGARGDPGRTCRYFVYALLLQDAKIYVGETDNIFQRLLDHFTMSRSTAQWVRMNGPPIRILEIITDADQGAENYLTLSYISKFGADAVRGGAWHGVFAAPPSNASDFRAQKLYNSLTRSEIDDVERDIRENIKFMATNVAKRDPDVVQQ
jgi:hypothetical protein